MINQGILLESNAPAFYYTKLGDLKIEMLGEAARRENAGRQGRRKHGKHDRVNTFGAYGVMQITAPNSTEVSDYGVNDTGSIDKDVTAVVNVSFAID